MQNINKIQWFSRHAPTQAQVANFNDQDAELVGIEEGQRLGALDLQSDEDLEAVLTALRAAIAANGANAVAGVPSTPILGHLALAADHAAAGVGWAARSIPFYASWNVSRCVDGGKPTFAHKKFVFIGRF